MENISSYEDCFAAYPETQVVKAKYYGSYQGEFLCKIIHKGEELFIHDWFGSCSGCDSFEREFGFGREVTEEKVKDFAKPYIESALPFQKMLEILESDCGEWDEEKKEMIKDLKNGEFGEAK